MSSINSVGGNNPVQQVTSTPIQKSVPTSAPVQNRVSDSVQLTGVNGALAALKRNDIRADKVASIKSQIEAGTYDADGAKLDSAIDKLLDDLTK